MNRSLIDNPLSLVVLDGTASRAMSVNCGYISLFSFHEFKGSDFIEFNRGVLK